ncbi:MAG: hypothetical protein EOO69_12135 [Moraxellaceae bacterium]|nr:MAG: hypothetical protein EOO69_12135 [Moraxellaceae bacterium]
MIQRACNGEEIIIAKNNQPLVELVIHQPKSQIKFGLLENDTATQDLLKIMDIDVADDFYNNDIFPDTK